MKRMRLVFDWLCACPPARLACAAVCCGSVGGLPLHVGEAASGLWNVASAPIAWLWAFKGGNHDR